MPRAEVDDLCMGLLPSTRPGIDLRKMTNGATPVGASVVLQANAHKIHLIVPVATVSFVVSIAVVISYE